MENQLLISIIIPAYNAQTTITKTLEACLSQNCPYEYEIIVVDDGSTDSTADIVKSYPVRHIYQKNAGPAKARNTGWKASTGEIVCFTDSDCIPHLNWVSTLIGGFDSGEIGAVAGSYEIANKESLLAQCIHEEIKYRHARFGHYIRAFGSYNIAIRRDVLEQVHGFDESYRTASGEDNDLSYKILKAGYKIAFRGDALVAHHHTERLWKYLKEQYRHGYWRTRLYRDHPDMIKGDDYTQWKDVIEPFLAITTLFLIPLFWILYAKELLLIILFCNFILQIKIPLIVSSNKKDIRFFYLILITFLRSFARGIGMFKGILHIVKEHVRVYK